MKSLNRIVLSGTLFLGGVLPGAAILAQQMVSEPFHLILKNESAQVRMEEVVVLSVAEMQNGAGRQDWKKLLFNPKDPVPHQLADSDGDGIPEEVLVQLNFLPGEEKKLIGTFSAKAGRIQKGFPKKTQAEISHKVGGKWENQKYKGGTFKKVSSLAVPTEHTDHSEYIRYEGPGWESDKVGYRFYLDWRNAVDVFGKKISKPVLHQVGLDGFDSYHEPANWGMDILKVGKSLGVGSIGFWDGQRAIRVEKTGSLLCEIVENGNLRSRIRTTYRGWEINETEVDLVSELAICAGERLSRQALSLSDNLPNLCTGIGKHEGTQLLRYIPENPANWGYMATYGQQSLAGDNLGLAIFFKGSDLLELTEDAYSHVLVLHPENGQLTYYFSAAWEQEAGGVKSLEAFQDYLDTEVLKLNQTILVNY